jgi:ketosteroid isomerase-like protein
MAVEENKATVRRFFEEVLDRDDRALGLAIFAPDCVRRFPGHTITGTDNFRSTAPRPTSAFRTTIHDLFAEGDRVVARITHRVTYTEDIAAFPRVGPVAAAGKSVAWDAIAIFRLRDGRIVEEWVSRDELGMLQQFGVIPADGQPSPESASQARIHSPRLAHPEHAADFAKQTTEAPVEER